MRRPWGWIPLLPLAWLAGCNCESADLVELESDFASSSSGDAPGGSSAASSDGSPGAPFNASRWVGRYHFEHPFSPFGERTELHETYPLVNFEVFADGRATMFLDRCYSDEPVIIAYHWLAAEDGWLDLHPGMGEVSLRFLDVPEVETLRVRMSDACRELEFEVDGAVGGFMFVRPGEACWVDRCTTPGIMHIDYCEGEEPPPCP